MTAGRRKIALFVAVVIVAVGLATGYSAYSLSKGDPNLRPTAGTAADRQLSVAAILHGPHLMFRSTSRGPTYGRLALVPLNAPGGPRAVTNVSCDRVYGVAETSLCVSAELGALARSRVVVLDQRLRPQHDLTTGGIPSRAQLSTDGRLASTTTFVTGHSYAETGFSTAAMVYETETGKSYGNLERWTTYVDGQVYRSPDVNVWGVTFAPAGDTFYATMSSAGRTYLVEGDLAKRTLSSMRPDVECPSLSPDGSRIAYKKRVADSEEVRWRLHVLDLATGHDIALSEQRTVDDQAEWLDDRTVIYGLVRSRGGTLKTDVWSVPADGGGEAAILIPRAWSPAVVR